ncbi:MAG: helix-turn-helix domain-containing protein, partial [Acidimicrobiales bacterium]
MGAPDLADDWGAIAAATSAFGDPTRRDIYQYSASHAGGVTTAEVAEHFELHPNVARHHLQRLAAGGYVEVFVERAEAAGAGRPSKRYRVSQEERLRFPTRRDGLLVTLLGRALALVPAEQA